MADQGAGSVGRPVGRPVGRVVGLTRYPLRSAAGEQLAAVACTGTGLAGDRAFVLVDGAGRPLRRRQAPVLATLSARLLGPDVQVRDAAGTVLGAEDLARATGVAGAGTAPAAEHDAAPGSSAVAPLHLVSVGAEAGPDAEGCDPDPRANVVVELDPPLAGGAERGWLGTELVIGPVRLRVTRTPRTCLGVYADVLVPGSLAVGDVVRLLPGQTGGGTVPR